MKLFRKEKTLYLKHKGGETIDDLSEKLYNHLKGRYPSCKLRGNYLEFEVLRVFRPTSENGVTGSIELFEEEDCIRAEVTYADTMAAAGSIMILLLTSIFGVMSFFNSDKEYAWMLLILLPSVGLVLLGVNALIFQLFGSYRFNKLVNKVRFHRDEVE